MTLSSFNENWYYVRKGFPQPVGPFTQERFYRSHSYQFSRQSIGNRMYKVRRRKYPYNGISGGV